MVYRDIPVEPFDYVVFGATGDLAHRKLMPALYHRLADGQMPDGARIIATARREMDNETFRGLILESLSDFVPDDERSPEAVDRFLSMVSYLRVDAAGEDGWANLGEHLAKEPDRTRAFYLAVGPDLFGTICERLGTCGLATPKARIVIEKPIGHDLASARTLNDCVGRVFSEDQIFRIDHYLGKETVQNLMVLRFANVLYEHLWNSAHVDHVQITVAESIGVGTRGNYYDTAGALRDMVQNHLLQLLCLTAMEPPDSMDANAVRDEKLKVLKALKPITPENVELTVRGQYRAGSTDGEPVDGYLEEIDDGSSRTETFVAIKAEIANWRWAGVPFYLRTGKRLAERASEIVIVFRPIPHSIFAPGTGQIHANRLVLRLQPDESVRQWIMIKQPGPGGMQLKHAALDMAFAEEFETRHPDAYERLLLDVVRGNQTLFMRRDEVEAAWEWIDPILEAWDATSAVPQPSVAGTWGPSAAVALIERDGRTWHEDTHEAVTLRNGRRK